MNYKKLSKITDSSSLTINQWVEIPQQILGKVKASKRKIEEILSRYQLKATVDNIYFDSPTLWAQDWVCSDMECSDVEAIGTLSIDLTTGKVSANGATRQGVPMEEVAEELKKALNFSE